MFTDWALTYLRERARQPGQPFFLYLAYNAPYSPIELYNLREDPYEQRNLASEQSGRVEALRAALRRHIQRGGATPWQAPQRPQR